MVEQTSPANGSALNSHKCCCMVYTWTPNKFGILHPSLHCQKPRQLLLPPTWFTFYPSPWSCGRNLIPWALSQPTWNQSTHGIPPLEKSASVHHHLLVDPHDLPRSWGSLLLLFPLSAHLPPSSHLSFPTVLGMHPLPFYIQYPQQIGLPPKPPSKHCVCPAQSWWHWPVQFRPWTKCTKSYYITTSSPLGQAMEVLIHTYQLWASLQGHVLSDTWQYLWIPNCWLSHLWSTMYTNHISIKYQLWTVLLSVKASVTSWKISLTMAYHEQNSSISMHAICTCKWPHLPRFWITPGRNCSHKS